MSYLIYHHGSFWFQIRVPRQLTHRYGQLIRDNLNTNDRTLAQSLAYQLAGQWLGRFSAERAIQASSDTPAPVMHSAEQRALDSVVPQPPRLEVVEGGRPENGVAESTSTTERQAPRKHTLDDLMVYWRDLHPNCSSSTDKEMSSTVNEFKGIAPKLPAEVSRQDMMRYRDILLAKKRVHATVRKKLGFIATLLQTAVDAGTLEANVAKSIRVPRPKVEPARRRAFTTEELERIFSSPVYRDGRRDQGGGGEAAVWIPLIALATGARLEEICQLRVDDILHDPVHGALLRITDEGEGQRLKTTSSRRMVPVHPELIKAGLLEYVEVVEEDGHPWLFPALEPDHDGRRSGNFSKWFGRYLRSTRGCGIADRAVVLHSFRHTFKSLCREADIAEEVHDAVTGHAPPTVGRGYGQVPLPALVRAIRKIEFPITLPRPWA